MLNKMFLCHTLWIFVFILSYRTPIKKPCFNYYWGRKDCPTSPYTNNIYEFPQPTMNSTEMFDYFQETFNLDIPEVQI